jgi:hypothetical protein
LVNIITEWQKYLDEPEHRSIRKRPGIDSDVSVPIKTQRVRYFYSGLPTNDGDKIRLLGMEKAKELQKQYPNPIDLYTATIDDIKSIKGFGKNIAENIYNFLRGT